MKIDKYKNLTILYIIIYICTFGFSQKIEAQEKSSTFLMSSVGSLQNMSNNSMAVNFSSNVNCFNIQNGSAILTGDRGSGIFSIHCALPTVYNTLGIKLFPNPVVVSTKVKFINMPPLEDIFWISVWNTEGVKVNNIKSTGYEIFQGKILDFGLLSTGSYIIQIESEKFIDALKFIKVN